MRIARQVRALNALVMMNGLKPIVRSPLWLVVELSFPLTLIFFISLYASEKAVSEALIGAAISLMTMSGLALQSDVVWLRVELKFQDMAVASPISPTTYMLGLALSELAYSSPAIILILALMIIRGMLRLESIPFISLSLVLCWLFATSLGFYLSTRITDLRHIWALSSLLSVLISMLPPVYYSIELLPGWAQMLSYLVPTTHAALLAKDSVNLASLSLFNKLISFAILLAWTIMLTIIAAKRSTWREK
ncbi:MAG: ABC transporter permease [Nitrososphaerota archaeon]